MISEYARYMKGGYQIPDLMKLKKNDFMFWYRIHERQIVESIIVNDFVSKKKIPPEGIALRNRVDNYIKKRREEMNR
jgi:hypothetical protein